MDLSFLPGVNASLNAVATVLLLLGRRFIRMGRIDAHRRTMLAAFGVSSVFLVLYVSHKASKSFENTTFNAEGVAKAAYLVLLASHIILAMSVNYDGRDPMNLAGLEMAARRLIMIERAVRINPKSPCCTGVGRMIEHALEEGGHRDAGAHGPHGELGGERGADPQA